MMIVHGLGIIRNYEKIFESMVSEVFFATNLKHGLGRSEHGRLLMVGAS